MLCSLYARPSGNWERDAMDCFNLSFLSTEHAGEPSWIGGTHSNNCLGSCSRERGTTLSRYSNTVPLPTLSISGLMFDGGQIVSFVDLRCASVSCEGNNPSKIYESICGLLTLKKLSAKLTS